MIDDIDASGNVVPVPVDDRNIEVNKMWERLRSCSNNGDLIDDSSDERLLAALKIFGFDVDSYLSNPLSDKELFKRCDSMFRKYSSHYADDKIKANVKYGELARANYSTLYDTLNSARDLLKENSKECIPALKRAAIRRCYQEIETSYPNLTNAQYVQMILLSDISLKIDVEVEDIQAVIAHESEEKDKVQGQDDTVSETKNLKSEGGRYSFSEKLAVYECLQITQASKGLINKALELREEQLAKVCKEIPNAEDPTRNQKLDMIQEDYQKVCDTISKKREFAREKVIAITQKGISGQYTVKAEDDKVSAKAGKQHTSAILDQIETLYAKFICKLHALLSGPDRNHFFQPVESLKDKATEPVSCYGIK